MTARLPAVLLVGLLLAADTPNKGDATKDDLAKFEGTWKVQSATLGGEEVPPEAAEKMEIVVSGTTIAIKDADRAGKDGKPEEASFKLDPSKKPAHIDLTPTKKDDKRTVQGIYEFDGDTLKLCWNKHGTRPTEFASKPGTDMGMFVLKRAKK
jgi:uncharacterized protein (TIGR03067 family)